MPTYNELYLGRMFCPYIRMKITFHELILLQYLHGWVMTVFNITTLSKSCPDNFVQCLNIFFLKNKVSRKNCHLLNKWTIDKHALPWISIFSCFEKRLNITFNNSKFPKGECYNFFNWSNFTKFFWPSQGRVQYQILAQGFIFPFPDYFRSFPHI